MQLKGHVVAIGNCSGAFDQAPLNQDGTESKVWIEPHPEEELGLDNMWEAVCQHSRAQKLCPWAQIHKCIPLHIRTTFAHHIFLLHISLPRCPLTARSGSVRTHAVFWTRFHQDETACCPYTISDARGGDQRVTKRSSSTVNRKKCRKHFWKNSRKTQAPCAAGHQIKFGFHGEADINVHGENLQSVSQAV